MALALLPALVAAQPFTEPTLLDPAGATDGGDDDDSGVHVVSAPNGTWVAVWGSDRASGFLLARSDDDGRTWSTPRKVLPGARGSAPGLATDGAGHWVAVWHDADICIGCDDVWVSHSTDDTATWSTPRPIQGAETPGVDDLAPSVTVDAAGTFVAVWQAVEEGLDGRRFGMLARSTDGGATWTVSEQWVDGSDIQVAAGGSTMIAVWDYGYDGVFYARSADGGDTWGPAVVLHDYGSTPDYNQEPVVATDRHGVWIVVWERGRSIPSYDDYYGAVEADLLFVRSEDDGLTWTEPAWLNSNADDDRQNSDTFVRLAANEHGVWAAAWQGPLGPGLGGGDGDVLVVWSHDGGRSWEPPQALNRTAVGDAAWDGSPDIAGGDSGVWVAVWSGWGLYGIDFDVLFERAACGCAPCDVCDAAGRCVAAPRGDWSRWAPPTRPSC